MSGSRCGAVLERRRLRSRQSADDARDERRQRVAAGIDDAGFAKRRQQVGAALHGALAGLERAHDHPRDRRVLLLGGRVRAQPGIGHPGGLRGDLHRHLAHDGQDRALDRLAHRSVRLVRGTG